jgi:hypothetical protein
MAGDPTEIASGATLGAGMSSAPTARLGIARLERQVPDRTPEVLSRWFSARLDRPVEVGAIRRPEDAGASAQTFIVTERTSTHLRARRRTTSYAST